MRVIGQAAEKTFLVEMTAEEIAIAAGFGSTYSNEWMKQAGGRTPSIGTVIKVAASYNYHQRIKEHQDQASSAANTLRALADLIGGAIPDVVIPPASSAPEGGEE